MTGPIRVANLLDTHVGQDQPNTNYNLGGSLYIRQWASSIRVGYIYFTRPFPLGATITSATLHLYGYAKPVAGTIQLYLRRLAQTITYGKVTWNSRATAFAYPEAYSSKTGTYPDREEYTFDITAQMQTVSDGAKWYGYQLGSDWVTETWSPRFMSANHPDPDLRPWVEITWSDAPDTPTQLAPAGGRAVSVSRPILRCDYTDVSGDTDLGAIQVQTSSTSSFTTPTFDSAPQNASTPEFNLNAGPFPHTLSVTTTNLSQTIMTTGVFEATDVGATITGTGIPAGATITAVASATSATISAAATATGTVTATISRPFTALTNGQVVWWRVRVQDGAGLWSGWSAPASFTYRPLPTVSIDNPAAAPNNFVEEPTPPITWTSAGQQSYAIDLYRSVSGKWTSIYRRGRTVSTVTDGFRVPAGVITVKDATYRVNVRVWDGYDREATPGANVYQLASRDFTYNFSTLTTPVNTLAASPQDPYPGIRLTWQRAAMPDSYSIIRDGQIIASSLDPDNDTWQGGTSYAWTDRFPIKKRAHVYSVQAVVNGKASDTNPTVTATNNLLGTWLVGAAAGGWQVCIVNDKTRTFEFTEDSAVYDVLGATTRALVTQTLRGYSGEVSGELMAQVGGTSESAGTWRNRLLELKAVAGQLVYLFITDMTTPVVLQNVQCSPSVRPLRSYNAAFTWHQQELPVGFSPKGLL